ncbi:unnamed protein product [Amoebophrya sp. A25]|nr:unnamed protein product [Amoebophrya sp. A25]|eukprot:GSA25T00027230001.1
MRAEVGASEQRLRRILDAARKTMPSVIILDGLRSEDVPNLVPLDSVHFRQEGQDGISKNKSEAFGAFTDKSRTSQSQSSGAYGTEGRLRLMLKHQLDKHEDLLLIVCSTIPETSLAESETCTGPIAEEQTIRFRHLTESEAKEMATKHILDDVVVVPRLAASDEPKTSTKAELLERVLAYASISNPCGFRNESIFQKSSTKQLYSATKLKQLRQEAGMVAVARNISAREAELRKGEDTCALQIEDFDGLC